jgi:hypothetical protein
MLSDELRGFCGMWSDHCNVFADKAAALEAQKDGAYAERDKLVTLISKVFPAHLERHPDSDTTWDDDWRWIVFVELPTGQCSWHIHDNELQMFEHLQYLKTQSWDGHTTEQKYERVLAYAPYTAA